jgi:hypothetical protein
VLHDGQPVAGGTPEPGRVVDDARQQAALAAALAPALRERVFRSNPAALYG